MKKYREILPLGSCLGIWMAVKLVETLTHTALRGIPRMLLFWGILLSALFLVWKGAGRVLKNGVWKVFLGMVGACVICLGILCSIIRYEPEHVVEKNGVKTVACVRSFLQETVSYYEYKNVLFRGDVEIGYEDYGNGGRDPLEEEGRKPVRRYFEK